MEDVKKVSICRYLQIIPILLIALIIDVDVFAAKQGSIGQRSSGSVNISVTIPNKVKLFVDGDLEQSGTGMCLRILDTSARSGFKQYQIRIQDTGSLSNRTEQLILNNMYGLSIDTQKYCDQFETSLLENINAANANATVLMFVPE